MRRFWKLAVKISFAAYCVLMLWLLFGQRMGGGAEGTYLERLGRNINLAPFRTMLEYVAAVADPTNGNLVRHAVINLLGNIIMFVPLGFFLSCVQERLRTFPRHLLCVAAIITGIELFQMFTLLGSCDIDDLILNLLGAAIGYGLFRVSAAVMGKRLSGRCFGTDRR